MTALNDLNALQASIAEAVLGQDEVNRQIIVGLLANGHLLLESLPGLAKTRTVKALARHLDAQMSRIQFTPDLLPSDITGAEVLHQVDGQNLIRFQPGPLFGNLILADEINRAPAKVQAALLEAMEERQITVAGNSHPLPAARTVYGAGYAKSHRTGRYLPAARGADGPLCDESAARLPKPGR